MIAAQFGEHAEAVAVRKIEIEQDEIEIGMLLDQSDRLRAVRRLQNLGATFQLRERAAHGFADQFMIVDYQEFHTPWFRFTSGWKTKLSHCRVHRQRAETLQTNLIPPHPLE